jgi:hypothetical protein
VALEQAQPHSLQVVVADPDPTRLDHAKQARAVLARQLQKSPDGLRVADAGHAVDHLAGLAEIGNRHRHQH